MKLGKGKVAWDGITTNIATLINSWRPSVFKNEVGYRDDLLIYLRQSVPEDTQIEKEYRHLGTTADIWIKWKGFIVNSDVAIEIKVNLKRKTEFDRLIGQLEALNPRENNVLLVLIGDTNESLVGRVLSKYSEQISPLTLAAPQTFAIVQVMPTSPAL